MGFLKNSYCRQYRSAGGPRYDYPAQFHGIPLIVATVLFAFQIYCDFSGYSDIAIGSAKVMGFKLMNNFDRPYSSKSIAEFWRRWHISLSSWFRITFTFLWGKSSGEMASIFQLTFCFFGKRIVAWRAMDVCDLGGLFGLYLVISLHTKFLRERLTKILRLTSWPRLLGALQLLITFSLVCFSWIIFRAASLSDAWYIFTARLLDGVHYLRAGSEIPLIIFAPC